MSMPVCPYCSSSEFVIAKRRTYTEWECTDCDRAFRDGVKEPDEPALPLCSVCHAFMAMNCTIENCPNKGTFPIGLPPEMNVSENDQDLFRMFIHLVRNEVLVVMRLRNRETDKDDLVVMAVKIENVTEVMMRPVAVLIEEDDSDSAIDVYDRPSQLTANLLLSLITQSKSQFKKIQDDISRN